MMELFNKDYLSAKRKKRMFSEVFDNKDYIIETERCKRNKISRREQLKELKLIQYFENLILSTEKIVDWEMENSSRHLSLSHNEKEIFDDILIENSIEKDPKTIYLWDQEKFNTFLHYEKMALQLFDFSKNISNESNRVILRDNFIKIQHNIFLSFLVYFHSNNKSDLMNCEFEEAFNTEKLIQNEYKMCLD